MSTHSNISSVNKEIVNDLLNDKSGNNSLQGNNENVLCSLSVQHEQLKQTVFNFEEDAQKRQEELNESFDTDCIDLTLNEDEESGVETVEKDSILHFNAIEVSGK